MLCAGDEAAKNTSGKILRPETKTATVRTQIWPDRPFAWPLAEHMLSARQDRVAREASQSTCRCRR
ncbi:hypothetical protein H0O02_02570 [Candidatus Micrarchaeota archaeon]|nr:hypothetical protein [Candidatus Micrarchaeota archaeon]